MGEVVGCTASRGRDPQGRRRWLTARGQALAHGRPPPRTPQGTNTSQPLPVSPGMWVWDPLALLYVLQLRVPGDA